MRDVVPQKPVFIKPDGSLSPPAMPMRAPFWKLVGLPAPAPLDVIRAHLRAKALSQK